MPLGEGANSASSTDPDGSITTSARLEGPPNFSDPIEPQLSPPPTYAQLRGSSKPEVFNNLTSQRDVQHGAVAPVDHATRSAATVAGRENIQHYELQEPMNDRLSSVPSYPVFLDVHVAVRPRRRGSSLASTNTTGILLSVGSLPGSEPFKDVSSENYAAEGFAALEAGAPVSPLLSPLSPFEASVAHVMTVHRVRFASGVSRHCRKAV